MLLPFADNLFVTPKGDIECARLADRHYSRQKHGSPQFMPPGRTCVIRDSAGLIVFGWLWQEKRDDGQRGFNCSIFRNESARKGSDVILEAESIVVCKWGQNRMFTYVSPDRTRPIIRHSQRVIGYCFRKAGWKPLIHKNGKPYQSTKGLPVFVKLRNFGIKETNAQST
jgi:hypothetical protein